LKGAVGNFDPKTAFAAVQQLEGLARTGQLQNVDTAYLAMESELKVLTDALRKMNSRAIHGHGAPRSKPR
jgi:hypothetical protein